jgi:hypothetical protein
VGDSIIKIGKFEAARRQLRTAIRLWFNDGDPVSIHTLAFAAYEIIHAISEKRDPFRRDLLFDTVLIKDEYRQDWNRHVRKHANFFKHADRDGDSVIEFNPDFSEWFIFFAIAGRELCGEQASDEESTFMWWMQIHKPHILTEQGRKMVSDHIPIDGLQQLRTLAKHEFFEVWREARRASNKRVVLAGHHTLRLP